jgi:hypothetical protein
MSAALLSLLPHERQSEPEERCGLALEEYIQRANSVIERHGKPVPQKKKAALRR